MQLSPPLKAALKLNLGPTGFIKDLSFTSCPLIWFGEGDGRSLRVTVCLCVLEVAVGGGAVRRIRFTPQTQMVTELELQ